MIVIGRKDKIDLPQLELFEVEAKIDTGAFGSALHCHHAEIVCVDGEKVLSFKLLDPTHPEYDDKVFYVKQYTDKEVKSSSGVIEHRYVFETEITIFGETQSIEFSLTNRSTMKYPILLGRKFLSKRYLVDVQQKDLSFKNKNNKI